MLKNKRIQHKSLRIDKLIFQPVDTLLKQQEIFQKARLHKCYGLGFYILVKGTQVLLLNIAELRPKINKIHKVLTVLFFTFILSEVVMPSLCLDKWFSHWSRHLESPWKVVQLSFPTFLAAKTLPPGFLIQNMLMLLAPGTTLKTIGLRKQIPLPYCLVLSTTSSRSLPGLSGGVTCSSGLPQASGMTLSCHCFITFLMSRHSCTLEHLVKRRQLGNIEGR